MLVRRCAGRHVDADRRQALEMLIAKEGIDDVEGAVSLRETLGDERQQELIGLVGPLDERTDVAVIAEIFACQPNGRRRRGSHGHPTVLVVPSSLPRGGIGRQYHGGRGLDRDRSV
jgi:hypothetical protein